MPIFEYRCRDCGHTEERIQRTPEEAIDCPRCGKPASRAVSVFSGAAAGGDGGFGGCGAPGGSGFS